LGFFNLLFGVLRLFLDFLYGLFRLNMLTFDDHLILFFFFLDVLHLLIYLLNNLFFLFFLLLLLFSQFLLVF